MVEGEGGGTAWRVVPTSFEADLADATQAVDGPYAVGDDGIVVVGREDGWETVIQEDTLEANSTLRGVDTTDDGTRVWFAGSAGVLGVFHVESGAAMGYDYAGEAADSWQEIAVAGDAGEERALLANDDGAVLSLDVTGEDVSFSEPTHPADGEEIAALTTAESGVGYAAAASGGVYTATPTGWESVGTVGDGTSLTDIHVDADRLVATTADGRLYEHDDEEWVVSDVADDPLYAVGSDGEETLVLADDATFYGRPDASASWDRDAVEAGSDLAGLSLGPVDVAVGEDGTVVQRTRDEQRATPVQEADDADLPPTGGTDPSGEEATVTPEVEDPAADEEPTADDGTEAGEKRSSEDGAKAGEERTSANEAEASGRSSIEMEVQEATASVEAAVGDVADAVTTETSMSNTTELVVEELLHRAETDELLTLLSDAEAGEVDLRERLEEIHAEPGPGCGCGEDCTCGADCTCGRSRGCECGPECSCGPDCACGELKGCQCGADCTCDPCACGEVNGCECGADCECGPECACSERNGCCCDPCTCEDCACGNPRGCECGADCTCENCRCGFENGCMCGEDCTCGPDCGCGARPDHCDCGDACTCDPCTCGPASGSEGEHGGGCCEGEGGACSCGPECDCGATCRCDSTGNCQCDRCTCGHDECTCGTVSEHCTCGGNCTCGHDCTCGSSFGGCACGGHDGGACSCGPTCDCGPNCACDTTGNCQCDCCTCGHEECTCGTVSPQCTCGGNCTCGHDCSCGGLDGHDGHHHHEHSHGHGHHDHHHHEHGHGHGHHDHHHHEHSHGHGHHHDHHHHEHGHHDAHGCCDSPHGHDHGGGGCC